VTDHTVSAGILTAIAGRHGVALPDVRTMSPGIANHTYALGDALVLRIPRTAAFGADLRKEAAVIPVARDRGVRTPELIEYDDSGSLVDVPYLVLRRAPGVDLEQLDLPTARATDIYRAVGRELARLHTARPEETPGLAGLPTDDDVLEPDTLITRMTTSGHLDRQTAAELSQWFGRLAARRPGDVPLRLLHGDIAPQNLLAHPHPPRLSGIVDWGDAAWSDPAADFAKVPMAAVPAMLAGYHEQRGEPAATDEVWAARILWYHLLWGVQRLEDPAPRPGERHWTAPPASRLLSLLQFFASGPPAPWRALG